MGLDLYKDEPCALYCTPQEESYYEKFDGFAEDGTPCLLSKNKNMNSMCLQGVCQVRL